MTRYELEQHVADAVAAGKPWIYLVMNGDPHSSRQRLLGAKWGPYGWVVGHDYPDNVVRYNAEYVQEYLDELPVDRLSADEDVRAEIASDELLRDYCNLELWEDVK